MVKRFAFLAQLRAKGGSRTFHNWELHRFRYVGSRSAVPFLLVIVFSIKMNESKKQCLHCKSEVDADATRCPQCRGDLRVWKNLRSLKDLRNLPLRHKIISGAVVLIIALSIFGQNRSGYSSEPQVTPAERQIAVEDFKKLLEAAAREGIVEDVKGEGTASLEIYVGEGWYKLPYETKIRTLNAISMTHRTATGNFLLKARDYISGRVVGEVTMFGNVKIY